MTTIIETSISEFVKKVEPAHVLRLSYFANSANASFVEDKCAMFSGQVVRDARNHSDFYRATSAILRGLVSHSNTQGEVRFSLQYYVGKSGIAVVYHDQSSFYGQGGLAAAVRDSEIPGLIIVRTFADELCVDKSRKLLGCAKYAQLDVAVPEKTESAALV